MSDSAVQPAVPGTSHAARTIRLMWSISPVQMTSVLIATIVTALVPLGVVLATASVVQATALVMTGGEPAASVEQLAIALAALGFIGATAGIAQQYFESRLRDRMSNELNVVIMEKAASLRLRHFEDAAVYDRLQLAAREASFRPYQLFGDLLATVTNLVALISVAALLLTWNPLVALPLLFAPVPSVLASMWYGRRGWAVENDRAEKRRRANYLQFLVTNDRTVKEVMLYGLAGLFIARFRSMMENFYKVDRALDARQSLVTGVLGLISALATGIALVLAVRASVDTGNIGRLAGYLAAIGSVQLAAQGVFGRLGQLYEHNLFLGNLFGFLDIETGKLESGTRSFPSKLRIGIEFRKVSFSYPGTDRPVLEDVNFTVPAGGCVALVGRNGAGKTTLVKLLTRLYEPTSGTILVDDVPLEEYDLGELRRSIGIMLQDFVQFEATAGENIGYGDLSRLDDEPATLAAAERAGFQEVLSRFPEGLATPLGRWFAGGHQLSGGEWQRVALARAWMRAAAVTVLDEPTASMDAAAEARIFEQMDNLSAVSTSLLIAHRFSAVRRADRIIVLDQGKVVESGAHHELMAANGMYATLFKLQAAGYQEEVTAG
jgi:ATP-binding cassette, subfamily B, bacterial